MAAQTIAFHFYKRLLQFDSDGREPVNKFRRGK